MSEKTLQSSGQNDGNFAATCWTTENLVSLESLLEIGTVSTRHAATALCKLLHEHVMVDVPRLHTAPPHIVPKIYNLHDQPITAIYMQLEGKLGCDIMLAFDVEEAQNIAALMTSSEPSKESNYELRRSAVEELGSIMICSFLSAIANFVGLQMIPTPPQLTTDSFDGVLDGLLAKQAIASDFALIFDTRFKRNNSAVQGFLVVFPSLELQKLLIEKSRK